MKTMKALTTATLLLLFAGSAMASEIEDVAFGQEAQACITEVNQNVDYDAATRVRHNVVELKNTFSGYVLAIDTEIFTTSDNIAARKYASHCVAKAGHKPRKFSIERVNG